MDFELSKIYSILECYSRETERGNGKIERSLCVETISDMHKYSSCKGLSTSELDKFAALIVDMSSFDERLSIKLVRCMTPNSTVSENCVLEIFGAFSSFSVNLKLIIVKWIALVFDYVEPMSCLNILYQCFMHNLAHERLRPWLCGILYRLTRRGDVIPHRIKLLYKLQSDHGDDPPLMALLHLYKDYFNEMIVLHKKKPSKPILNGSVFKCPDSIWFDEIIKLQANNQKHPQPHNNNTDDTGNNDKLLYGLEKQRDISSRWKKRKQLDTNTGDQPPSKRARFSSSEDNRLLPHVKTTPIAPYPGWNYDSLSKKVWFEQLTSFNDYVKSIERVEWPDQIGSIIVDRNLMHHYTVNFDSETVKRFNSWLQFELNSLFFWVSNSNNEYIIKQQATLLEGIVKFVNFSQELPSAVVESFLPSFLKFWDGIKHFEPILKLLEWVIPNSFKEFHTKFLKPLEVFYFTWSIEKRTRLIYTYRSIVLHIILSNNLKGEEEDTKEKSKYCKFIYDFACYVDQLMLISWNQNNYNLCLVDAGLSFFELVSMLGSQFGFPIILPVSHNLGIRCLLSPSVMPVSRFCGLLRQYKNEKDFLFDKASNAKGIKVTSGTEYIEYLESKNIYLTCPTGLESFSLINNLILSCYHSLWREEIFYNTTSTKSTTKSDGYQNFLYSSNDVARDIIAHFEDKNVEKKLISRSLSIKRSSAAFSGLIAHFLRECKKKFPDKLTENNAPEFVEKCKAKFLQFLSDMGYTGLYQFMFTFVGELARSKERVS
eukprot:TRINITY_DN7563_c0_g1_i2.p1 TRINITY_DN7563_c0_g1~~TRINITY_DN7563_c0_g1_i2.p1  ORF type:complete len:769 (-),score=85.32 TRINITY_DN7563_c0_g1_i2:1445-3751(-)